MRWFSTAEAGPDLEALLDTALSRAVAALPDGRADLAFLFLGTRHAARAEEVPERLRAGLGACHVLGCGAGGVIGAGREVEQAEGLSLLAGRLPGAAVHGFHVEAHDLPDPDEGPRPWHELVGVSPADAPAFVLLADPFTLPADALLAGLDFAYPDSVKVGGLASGARRPGEQVLFHGDRAVRRGGVGVALMGDVDLVPAVAQGCRPLGTAMRITACDEHLLQGLDGEPVLEALRGALGAAPERDRHLARTSLFLGFETDPLAAREDGPWLIRNILGVDPRTRGLYVDEALRPGRRVRFHLRDRTTSAEDLERTLGEAAGAHPEAALLFACMGRGTHMYGAPDHDSQAFARHFGPVPMAGCFCNGEIGPVGRHTHLHGYTSSFGLLRPRAGRAS
jgi:small ligand-binding sensory domain FIST